MNDVRRRAFEAAQQDHQVEAEGIIHTWIAALIAAVAVVLSVAPWNLFPLAFLAFIPMLAITRGISPAKAFRRAFLFGILVNLGGFPWVIDLAVNFGDMPPVIGVLLLFLLAIQQGLIPAFAFLGARYVERWRGWKHGMALPFTYVAIEILWPMAFPWKIGHSQVFHLSFLQLAELGGVPLMTFVVLLVNVGIYHWIREVRAGQSWKDLPVVMWVALGAFAFTQIYGLARISAVDVQQNALPTLRIGMVEADIEIEDKWDARLYERNLFTHQKLSEDAVEKGAEFIIWPESAFELSQFYYQETADGPVRPKSVIDKSVYRFPPSSTPLERNYEIDQRQQLVPSARLTPQRGFRTPLLAGTTLFRTTSIEEMERLPPNSRGAQRRYLFFNSTMLLDADGVVQGTADKVTMMPISEEIPGAQLVYDLTGINLYAIVPSSGLFGSGEGPAVLSHTFKTKELEREARIGILNCYEDLMPHFVRGMYEQRPNILVNQTNDAWFGRALAPAQHMALAIPRAVEARTWLLRATNTGVTAFIDATGRVQKRSSTRDAENLVMDVPLKPVANTLFRQTGDLFGWLCVAFLGWSVLIELRRRRAS